MGAGVVQEARNRPHESCYRIKNGAARPRPPRGRRSIKERVRAMTEKKTYYEKVLAHRYGIELEGTEEERVVKLLHIVIDNSYRAFSEEDPVIAGRYAGLEETAVNAIRAISSQRRTKTDWDTMYACYKMSDGINDFMCRYVRDSKE